MLLGNDGNPRLFTDDYASQMLIVKRVCDDRKIRQSSCQMLQHIIRASVPHLILHHRVFLTESRDKARGNIRRAAFHHPKRNGSGKSVLHMCQVRSRFVCQRQHLVGPVKKKTSRFCQLKMAFSAYKQLHAKIVLQRLDLIGQRRLTHIQLLCSSCEIQFLCYHCKVFQ